MNENQTNQAIAKQDTYRPTSKVKFMTQDEQRKFIRGSSFHQYGILFRLMVFTGISANELLALSWEDVDIYHRRLIVRRILVADGDGWAIQPAPSKRFIPIHTSVLMDITEWRDTRKEDIPTIRSHHHHTMAVATTLTGHQIYPDMLEYFFGQILRSCELPDSPVEILRNTFAVRALEQGMQMCTLCEILGDPDAGNTYGSFAYGSREANLSRMETLLTVHQPAALDITYPVLIKKLDLGGICAYVPNFPEASYASDNLAEALAVAHERMEDQLHNCSYPPTPVPVFSIVCEPGDYVIQVAVSL